MSPAATVSYVILDVPGITQNTAYMGIFRSLSGLEVDFDVYEYREGGNNDFVHRLPGRMHYPNLVLSWGLVDDESLLKWLFQTQNGPRRQEITITLSAAEGDLTESVRKFTFTDAFPVRWSGPQMAADSGLRDWAETLEIAHSGLKMP